jgi:hypothetical protein
LHDYERPEMHEDELITINYTSGTTGDPKGVMRTHRTETIHAYLTAHQQSIQSDDVYYWTLPMFHVNGWGHIFAVTGVGARHICARGFDPGRTFEKIVEEDVSYMCCAPTVMNMLIEHWEEEDPQTTGENDLRIASGGAAPPEATMRALEDDIGWYFKHMYGSTETGPLIVTSDYKRLFDQDTDARFEIKNRQGFGMLGTEIDVVDEDGDSVPHDDETIGEIVVRGNQIMEGYWNKPEETEEAFSARREGWFHTGDLATFNENGMLKIKDRKKDTSSPAGRTSPVCNWRTVCTTTPRSVKSPSSPPRARSGARRRKPTSSRKTATPRTQGWLPRRLPASPKNTSPTTKQSASSNSSTNSRRRRRARSRSTNSPNRSGTATTRWSAKASSSRPETAGNTGVYSAGRYPLPRWPTPNAWSRTRSKSPPRRASARRSNGPEAARRRPAGSSATAFPPTKSSSASSPPPTRKLLQAIASCFSAGSPPGSRSLSPSCCTSP